MLGKPGGQLRGERRAQGRLGRLVAAAPTRKARAQFCALAPTEAFKDLG